MCVKCRAPAPAKSTAAATSGAPTLNELHANQRMQMTDVTGSDGKTVTTYTFVPVEAAKHHRIFDPVRLAVDLKAGTRKFTDQFWGITGDLTSGDLISGAGIIASLASADWSARVSDLKSAVDSTWNGLKSNLQYAASTAPIWVPPALLLSVAGAAGMVIYNACHPTEDTAKTTCAGESCCAGESYEEADTQQSQTDKPTRSKSPRRGKSTKLPDLTASAQSAVDQWRPITL